MLFKNRKINSQKSNFNHLVFTLLVHGELHPFAVVPHGGRSGGWGVGVPGDRSIRGSTPDIRKRSELV